MGKIRILPDNLSNQIAAGEVVERPAAVVKELVENSIDAGSLKIHVALAQGGRKEIRVVDNGAGMSHDDALLAIERHATSKIKDLQDLQAIQSLGFRGEALPSIASVSRFELVTREEDSLSGTLIRVEGGILRDARETGCPRGTMVTVRDLFYNIPARRKFLRTVDTEMAHIGDQFLRLAMAQPQIHFQLIHQDRTLYDFSPARSPEGRVGQILGSDLSARMIPFGVEGSSLVLRGFLGPPELQRSNAQSLFLYVNTRPVWERMLTRAILGAYEAVIPKGKYPVVVLFVEIPHALVDINVHPTKREVRFRDPSEILERVRAVIFRSLEGYRPSNEPARGFIRPPLMREDQRPPSSAFPGQNERLSRPVGDVHASFTPSHRIATQVSAFPHPALVQPQETTGEGVVDTAGQLDFSSPGPGFSRLPLIGQLGNAYVLLEAPDGLVLIDQHAAHERILYDRLSSGTESVSSQRLLRSVVLQLLPREAAKLRRWMDELGRIGFEIESFGGDSFVIAAVPAVLTGCPPDILIREMLDDAHEDDKTPRWNLMANLVKTAACHSAVRAGQKLKPDEIRFLLEDLDKTAMPATCPHGRPLWLKLTHADIARLFHRT